MTPHINERQFSEFVAEQIRHGFSLVPFVGSGISASSGIVMGQDFMNYLTWVVYRSVADKPDQKGESRLDLRKEGWPEVPSAIQVEDAREWVGSRFEAICRACNVNVRRDGERKSDLVRSLAPKSNSGLIEARLRRPFVPKILRSPSIEKEDSDLRSLLWSLGRENVAHSYSAPPDVSITTESYISECAIRALHDWRCALDFLARLHVGDEGGLPLWLATTADQTIVDSFNFFITHGRKPNLAHNMLCHLASRARIRTILTTNFDTLLEDAFSQLGEHFEVIPVGIHGELPAPETVQAQNSIVKLHGALVDTRADPSLDERPKDRDLQRFFEYVRGKPVDSSSASFLPGLLLVCGYSASDLRCVQMIKYLLDADRKAKVFWVCHHDQGLEKLGRIFKEDDYEFAPGPHGNISSARIVATVTGRTDLLFYELYQRLTLGLPRGGFNYQFSPNVPPQRSFGPVPRHVASTKRRSKHLRPTGYSYSNHLEKLLTEKVERKVVVADGANGLMEPMRNLFETITHRIDENRKNGIWLELEDYPDTASVAHEIFTIIALRLGRFQLDHARLVPPQPTNARVWRSHITELLLHWAIAPADWFIVFYGRNGPGRCAGWEQTYWGSTKRDNEYAKFEKFLEALRTAKVPDHSTSAESSKPGQGFMLLYAPYSAERHDEDKARQNSIVKLTDHLRQQQRELRNAGKGEWTESEEWEERVRSNRRDGLSKRASRFRVSDENGPLIPLHDYGKNGALFKISIANEGELSRTQFGRSLAIIRKQWLEDPWKKESSIDKTDRLNARRALYAATLFRQARHFSAFLSEGVYPCPCRYNTSGVDNDWLRNNHVGVWLERWSGLSNSRKNKKNGIRSFFFNKPGGFAWTYHDSRLGVQRLIEGMGPLQFVVGRSRKSPAAQGRARMHFWIGEWYCRAYRATGHADPLLEAVYHFGECIHYCEVAMPLGIKLSDTAVGLYRFRLARRALLQLTKALRLGREELRLWIQAAAGEPWFGTVTKNVIEGFEGAFKKLQAGLETGKELYPEWLSDLRWEMSTLPQDAEDHTRELHLEKAGGNISRPVSRHPSPRLAAFNVHSPKKDDQWRKALGKQWATELAELKSLDAKEPFAELMEALKACGEGKDLANDLNKELKKWRNDIVTHYNPERLFILAQVTRELAYMFILRAKRRHHNLGADKRLVLDPKLARLWVQACGLCWLTLDLCDELPAVLLASETRLRVAACTLYGLALGRLGRFYEAHRRLNEAHAWLSKSAGMSEPPDAGVIKLRRAEVHIFEALRLRCILDHLSKFSKKGWKGILRSDPNKIANAVLSQWEEIYLSEASQTDRHHRMGEIKQANGAPVEKVFVSFLHIHIAKLDDAWLALESAERVLSGKSHSSLWWGHLHQLRLRVYATHWTPEDWKGELPIALAFRKRRNHLAAVGKIYHAGLAASRADPYHAIRLADYGLQAVTQLTGLGKAKLKDKKEFAHTLFSHFPKKGRSKDFKDSLLSGYRHAVERRIAKAQVTKSRA